MPPARIVDDKFYAQCQECGVWQEVFPVVAQVDTYFEFWQAQFLCCGRQQSAWFTIEKVDDEVH
ncbi:hypothetical protein [Desulfobacca acetoxidans]|uniref:Uncharacterized protein n=1 Tax=Desulfobacca acetoxidans (strain ATCC 700848 / DSM 11109 / ASRB2) TaxID=880072 RepID=F2NEC8_DESAR|nr:hypothetical protein [Desulfobacca acetoxidans]AEB08118.1 hypothetical protein Desac_0225 [Desulfobacca acetoxidans DSM 11109]HAY22323.1 hypothetical protein [Desulfobacterales bacterium]